MTARAWRTLRYRLVVPVFRSTHPPDVTARGVANGVFWALTPSVGLQAAAILVTWFVLRTVGGRESSLLQALVWAWLNNPLTMVPLYYAFWLTGVVLSGGTVSSGGYDQFQQMWADVTTTPWSAHTATALGTMGWTMALGCVPYAIVASSLAYRWTFRVVERRQQRRARIGEPAARL